MSVFGAVTPIEELEAEQDIIGGGGPLETSVYPAKVSMAYFIKSSRGAMGMFLSLIAESGQEIRETIYGFSGDAKGNKNYYVRDGKQYPLPGFTLLDNLGLLTVGKHLAELSTEEKVVNVYNVEAGKEVPTKVQVFTELLDQEILVALFKKTEIKQVKSGDTYVDSPTGETRDVNEIEKFFRAKDRKTVTEIRAEAEAVFIDAWLEKWKGVTKGAKKSTVAANDSNAGTASGKPTKSLFG